jgi:hypothetical protein
MKKIVFYALISFLINSCHKNDMSWNLKRLSPKDAKLEVSELIYSNNCSTLSDFQFIATGPGTPSSIYWGIANSGFSGDCFKTQGNSTNASITLNLKVTKAGILRFYFKIMGMPNETNNVPLILINSSVINTAIISGNQDSSGDWLQMQTEILNAGNNIIEIKFTGSTIKTYHIDEIELWSPLY